MSGDDDAILRGITKDDSFRVITSSMRHTVQGVLQAQRAQGERARRLGQLVVGTVLYRETMAPGFRVQAIVRDERGRGLMVADSHPSGDTRGLAQLEKDASRRGTVLEMMRSLANGSVHRGLVELADEGDLSQVLMEYLQTSEQVTSMVDVGLRLDEAGTVQSAGGYLVQLLPGATQDALRSMIATLEALPSLATLLAEPAFSARTLLDRIAPGAAQVGDGTVRFGCWCSEVSLMTALSTLERGDLEEIFDDANPLEVSCDYCGREYRLQPARLRGLTEKS